MTTPPTPVVDETGHQWRELSTWFGNWKLAEQAAVQSIGPWLTDLEDAGAISSWWFLRKGREWRFRWLPAPARDEDAAATLSAVLSELQSAGHCEKWAHTIYEPPLPAFGGPQALTSSHVLFHADSRHVLRHLTADGDQRRELGFLLVTALMRGARRDWYDQGQVWDLIAQERTTGDIAAEDVESVKLLLAGEPSPAVVPTGWSTAFDQAGRRHFDLDRLGVTTRGLNAVLAHHALYAWNRLGLAEPLQGAMAAAAAAAVFGSDPRREPAANGGRVAGGMANVAVVTTDTALSHDPAQLRDALADKILGRGTFRTAAVERAFRTVPREIFLNGVDLSEAYRPSQVVTKRDADGSALSSASDPNLVATMAEDLDVRPGQNILEIGAATGINAAILNLLTGPDGHVTTVEIDQDLTDGAAAALAKAGHPSVTVICGDGAEGWTANAPYERIIATVGVWDISTAWWNQLAAGGRIVIPLRLHGSGLTRSLAFDLQPDGRLTSSYARVCGFVPMRGAAAHATTSLTLADGVTLNLDTADEADTERLSVVLTEPADVRWIGLNVTDHEPVEHLDLWLATHTSGFSRLFANPAARSAGVADPALRWAGASLHDGGSLAYIAARQHGDKSKELGIVAHGPDRQDVADRLAELLRAWNHTRPARPVITAHRAGTPDDQLGSGTRIERPDTRLTITW